MKKTQPDETAIEMKLFLVSPGIGCKYLVKENPRSGTLDENYIVFNFRIFGMKLSLVLSDISFK